VKSTAIIRISLTVEAFRDSYHIHIVDYHKDSVYPYGMAGLSTSIHVEESKNLMNKFVIAYGPGAESY
jgi:hypothetical protein